MITQQYHKTSLTGVALNWFWNTACLFIPISLWLYCTNTTSINRWYKFREITSNDNNEYKMEKWLRWKTGTIWTVDHSTTILFRIYWFNCFSHIHKVYIKYMHSNRHAYTSYWYHNRNVICEPWKPMFSHNEKCVPFIKTSWVLYCFYTKITVFPRYE